MMKKLFWALFLAVVGTALHSCSVNEECGGALVVSSRGVADDGKPVPEKQVALSTSVGDLLGSGAETLGRLSNLYQRTLQQLFQQWNRMAIKAHSRYAQRAQAVSLFFYRVAHYIGYGADVWLYIYRIRHIVI